MVAAWIAAASLALVAVAAITSYNRFARQRALVANSWANVDSELQRRHDLVPNVVETVRGHAAHERETLEAVVHARARAVEADEGADPADRADSEQAVVAGLRRLLAVAEAYPALQADRSFLELQRELVTTENRIQAARRIYNGNVRELNRRVASIPSNLVATISGVRRASYFEIDAAVAEHAPVGLR